VVVIYIVWGETEEVVEDLTVEVVKVVGADVVEVAKQIKLSDVSSGKVPQKERNNGILKKIPYSLTLRAWCMPQWWMPRHQMLNQ
jgi:hypothetical protein